MDLNDKFFEVEITLNDKARIDNLEEGILQNYKFVRNSTIHYIVGNKLTTLIKIKEIDAYLNSLEKEYIDKISINFNATLTNGTK